MNPIIDYIMNKNRTRRINNIYIQSASVWKSTRNGLSIKSLLINGLHHY